MIEPHAPPGWPPGLRCPPLRRRTATMPDPDPTEKTNPNRPPLRRGLDEDDNDDRQGEPVTIWR